MDARGGFFASILLTGICLLMVACTGRGPSHPATQETPNVGAPDAISPTGGNSPESASPCAHLVGDDGPVDLRRGDTPEPSVLRGGARSMLPRVFPSAARIRKIATPILEDLPGRVRMLVFWGEPGAHEPFVDTPLSFLGVDGRWRYATTRMLEGDDAIGYLSAEDGDTLAPDGSRWLANLHSKLTLFNLGTGRRRVLATGSLTNTRWSPNSRYLAASNPSSRRVSIFSRDGRAVASIILPDKVGKRSLFLADDLTVTVFEQPTNSAGNVLAYSTYAQGTVPVREARCALPVGVPAGRVGVGGYDGRYIWLSSLVDTRRYVYRNTVIDTLVGSVVQDVRHAGALPYISAWVRPGVFITAVTERSAAIYAAAGGSAKLVPVARIEPFQQSGYENHTNSQFAADLIFSSARQ